MHTNTQQIHNGFLHAIDEYTSDVSDIIYGSFFIKFLNWGVTVIISELQVFTRLYKAVQLYMYLTHVLELITF